MPQVYVEDIAQHVGQEVTLKGWLYNKTDKGKLRFLLIRDGTGVLQAVVLGTWLHPCAGALPCSGGFIHIVNHKKN